MTNKLNFFSHHDKGDLNPDEWIDEGNGLFISSQELRNQWKHLREIFSATNRDAQFSRDVKIDNWAKLKGFPRASILLLGYSIEMYLKAGLIKTYKGSSIPKKRNGLMKSYGHKLTAIAKEIEFETNDETKRILSELKNLITQKARYPVSIDPTQNIANQYNSRNWYTWNDDNYESISILAQHIKEHVLSIDGDSSNPGMGYSFGMDQDGYIYFRRGGNLSTRVTYRLSSIQKAASFNINNILEIMFEDERLKHFKAEILHAKFYEDTGSERIPIYIKDMSEYGE